MAMTTAFMLIGFVLISAGLNALTVAAYLRLAAISADQSRRILKLEGQQ